MAAPDKWKDGARNTIGRKANATAIFPFPLSLSLSPLNLPRRIDSHTCVHTHAHAPDARPSRVNVPSLLSFFSLARRSSACPRLRLARALHSRRRRRLHQTATRKRASWAPTSCSRARPTGAASLGLEAAALPRLFPFPVPTLRSSPLHRSSPPHRSSSPHPLPLWAALPNRPRSFDPLKEFKKCKVCKTKVHQPHANYCQGCAYRIGEQDRRGLGNRTGDCTAARPVLPPPRSPHKCDDFATHRSASLPQATTPLNPTPVANPRSNPPRLLPKGICAMCGKQLADVKDQNQSST